MLHIKNLSAGYGNLQILRNLDLVVEKGDLAVVIGPNGSGKSTTVKSVFGLTTNFGGSITFLGKEVLGKPTHEIVKLGIGYVPQGRLVFDTLTVHENLEMGGYDLNSSQVDERIEAVLSIFPGLREKLSSHASFLSGGQQQQLSIARALMRQPQLLLLDEPSLGLDPKTQKLIFKTIQKINAAGTTVLMVEQNAYHALQICTRAYIIENGKVALQGGKELAKKKRVKELYLGGT